MLISGQKVPPQHRVMLDEDTFKFYLQSYSAPEQGGQGMEGGLNWYRTRRINYEDELSECGMCERQSDHDQKAQLLSPLLSLNQR